MARGQRAARLALGWGCCLLLCCAAASKVEVSMPAVVEVEIGDTARIECNFHIPDNGSYAYIDWFYVDHDNEVRLYHIMSNGTMEENTDYRGRLSLGEDKALSISEVSLGDSKTFTCRVGAGSYGVDEKRTKLLVYKLPEAPEISASSGGISVQNSEKSEIAQCVSRDGYPPPNITWHKDGEQLEQSSEVKMTFTQTRKTSGLYTVTSILLSRVTRQDSLSRFHCAVHYQLHGQVHTMESPQINITVFYPAEHVKVWVMPYSTPVKEGDNVQLVCEADGNPEPVYTFYKKELETEIWQDLLTTDSGVLNLHDVHKNSSGMYRCQALDLDDMRVLENEVELTVNYIEGVHVNMEPSSALHEGDSVRLTCDAHSPVYLDYHWRDEKGRKVAEGNQLFLSNLTFETSRNFICKVMAPSVPGLEQSKQVAVAVEGKPRIVAISSPLYVQQDEVVNLTCKAIAHPRPSLHWSVNGTAHNYVDNQHIASNLTVRVSQDLLRAGARCRVSNTLGVTEQHIQLLDQKATESKGVIIVAIIVAILLVAVLGSVIYFLHKKGKIPCGRAGKQDITKPEARKDKSLVDVKSDKLSEEAGLLQGANGEKRPAADQSEKYIDVRN